MNLRPFVLAVLLAFPVSAARAGDDAAPPHPAYWGAPSVDGGKCCASLAEVRDNIDRIDRADRRADGRARKIRRRGRPLQGRPGRGQRAGARRGDRRQGQDDGAGEDGLAESVAERSYRAMIAAFEDYEREEWTRRNAGGAPAK